VTLHPRQNWRGGRGWPWGARPMSRREFLRLSGGAAVGAAVLLACARNQEVGGTGKVLVGSPDHPVTHPILDDNPPIESGLQPESGPLQVYNWDQYIWKKVLNDFGEENGVDVELTTFYNLEEGVAKLRSGEVAFDIFFPTSEQVPKLVAGGLFQPLNHDYLPNLEANMWPQLVNPYYDQGSRYTVPYVVYQTGIGWRTDMVPDDIESMDNPWDVFWDPAHKDITGLYDDYRETIGVGLYHNGINDPNASRQAQIDLARDSLIELNDLVNVTYTIDGAYSKLPEGKLGLHNAWSGDLAAAPYYAPKGEDPTTLRYLWPPKVTEDRVGGYVSNDNMAIPRSASNPVLAHMFLNYLMGRKHSLQNFSWLLYQPPLVDLDPDSLVADGYILDNLRSTLVYEEDFSLGQIPLQLPPEVDTRWLAAWSEVQAGG
jgi:spermidine/putrescine transport system substrate-binding protein